MIRSGASAIAPSHELEERRAKDVGMRYLCMRPPQWDGKHVVVAVHGISRNHREHAELFLPECLEQGAALVVPRFSHNGYRGYQRLRTGLRGLTSDQALLAVLEDAQVVLGKPIRNNLLLFGFSGGAQFVHRFSLVHPQLVARQAVAAAGFYTFPRETSRYPYGLAKTKTSPDLDTRGFLLPTKVLVGDRDIERDDDLRVNADLDRSQGRNRLERARRWVLAVRSFSAGLKRTPACSLSLLASCDHCFSTCARDGQLVSRAMQFLLQQQPCESAGKRSTLW